MFLYFFTFPFCENFGKNGGKWRFGFITIKKSSASGRLNSHLMLSIPKRCTNGRPSRLFSTSWCRSLGSGTVHIGVSGLGKKTTTWSFAGPLGPVCVNPGWWGPKLGTQMHIFATAPLESSLPKIVSLANAQISWLAPSGGQWGHKKWLLTRGWPFLLYLQNASFMKLKPGVWNSLKIYEQAKKNTPPKLGVSLGLTPANEANPKMDGWFRNKGGFKAGLEKRGMLHNGVMQKLELGCLSTLQNQCGRLMAIQLLEGPSKRRATLSAADLQHAEQASTFRREAPLHPVYDGTRIPL